MRYLYLLSITLLMSGCSFFAFKKNAVKDDNQLSFTILQINDVYEITALEGGKVGGLARVATLKQQLLKENPNTLFVLAGDFLNPSVIGTLKYEGEKISGKQMVEVLNAAKLDYVTYGNHEFDIKEAELEKRINESQFKWVSSNTFHRTMGRPFVKKNGNDSTLIPLTETLTLKDADGTTLNVGFFGVTLPANKQDFVVYDELIPSAKRAYETLSKQADVVIGITHQSRERDIVMARNMQNVPLFIGGHEHANSMDTVGTSFVAKADANVKTAYVHRFTYNKTTKKVKLVSTLVNIDEKLAFDVETQKVVDKWTDIANKSFKDMGYNPSEVIAKITTPLDGREETIRYKASNMATLIAESMLFAVPTCAASILNTGSIRIDDQVSGEITQYDIMRILPFGGKLVATEMKGELLKKILVQGAKNVGKGGYLQHTGFSQNAQKDWLINGKVIEDATAYNIVLPEFLLTGKEAGLDFLTKTNPLILKMVEADPNNPNDLKRDVRAAVIAYLKAGKWKQ